MVRVRIRVRFGDRFRVRVRVRPFSHSREVRFWPRPPNPNLNWSLVAAGGAGGRLMCRSGCLIRNGI